MLVEKYNPNSLSVSAILGLIAMLICAAGDIASDKKHKQTI